MSGWSPSSTAGSALFRFYVEEEATETDRKNAEIIALNFSSSLFRGLEAVDIEFAVTDEPLGYLDTVDARVYRRWEPVD